jgi:hypothetical protein
MAMKLEVETGSTAGGGCRSAGGKVFGTLFFLFFLGMGLLFVVFILVETYRHTMVWFWPEAPCTVISSGVEETGSDGEPYRPVVLFEYRVDGRAYQSRSVTRSESTSSSYDRARRPADRYPPGSNATCRVNPDTPGEAVLERRIPWIGLVVFFPLIFVAIGGGGIYAMWKGAPKLGRSTGVESISQRARGMKNVGRKVELGVGIIFTLVGGSLTVFLLILPAYRLVAALDWVETPATVESSVVRSWSTDDGTSYRADVLYEYSAGGRSWRSNRRGFFPMSSSDYDDSRSVVDRHPAGSSIVCYVDPSDPSRSVLDRGLRPVYLIGLFPTIFLLAGVGLTMHALRSRPAAAPRSRGPEIEAEPTEASQILEPEAGPISKVVGMIIVAAIWNGIVSIFVWQVVKGFTTDKPEWFLTVFLIPFVLIGLALIFGIFYTFLAAFNPRPRITISPPSPRLGTRLRVDWEFSGRAGRIDRLEITLEGHEKATYRRGTDTHTDREAFASFDLVRTPNDWEIARGSAEVAIPEDTMHSFSTDNSGVVWSLYVHGDVPRWPDVMETFDVEIRPLARDRLVP